MKEKRFPIIRVLLLIILIVIFGFSAFMVFSQLSREQREAELFDTLVVDKDKLEYLHSLNSDLFGWIYIKGTKIDYPVMFTPNDPEFYLHHDFNKEYSASGVPFLDASYKPGCNMYLIYGHHMKNGTMFAALDSYAEKSFWKKHQKINFDTLEDGDGIYQVFAAFYSKKYKDTDTDAFKYYQYTDLSDQSRYEEFLEQVKKAQVYDTGIDVKYGDQLLMLSTCEYHTTDGRFVVVAKKVK